jgi:prevent-host-death family protein
MPLNLKDDIRPISYIKANAANVMNHVNESKSPIVITQNGEARAVLLDLETYQSMQNAFSLLSIFKVAEEELRSGQGESLDEVADAIASEYFPQ